MTPKKILHDGASLGGRQRIRTEAGRQVVQATGKFRIEWDSIGPAVKKAYMLLLTRKPNTVYSLHSLRAPYLTDGGIHPVLELVYRAEVRYL